jgi:F-type H+-transporting ATPase subunit epsilon
MLNNHAPIVSILKEGFVKISGNISIDKENVSKFEQKDKGFWLAINSGTIEMNANKIIVLAD